MPPTPQQPPTSQQLLEGPVHKVPCPWCGKGNDCRAMYQSMDTGSGFGSGFERGAYFPCDHCGNMVEVVKVQTVPIVQVKQRGQMIRAIQPQPKR